MGRLGLSKMACVVSVLCVATAVVSPAQTFNTLASFDGADGESPYFVSLVQGTNGSLYGTTTGATTGYGTVFGVTPAGKLNTLHRQTRHEAKDNRERCHPTGERETPSKAEVATSTPEVEEAA